MYLHAIGFYLLLLSVSNGDKLSPGQPAPLGADISGGLALTAPLRGSAADVGARLDVGRSGPPLPAPKPAAPATKPAAPPTEDGVTREETEELKEVNGELVRVVKGSLAYNSPEGLPVAIKYQADENGNRASFTIGTPGGGSGGGSGGAGKSGGGSGGSGKSGGGGSGGGAKPGGGGSAGGGKAGGGGGQSTKSGARPGGAGGKSGGDSTYLPPSKMNPERSYLPPS